MKDEGKVTVTVLATLAQHASDYGVMASPNHWAYVGGNDPDVPRWFAMCNDHRLGIGCGWDSKPNRYSTREEAWAAAQRHVADEVVKALAARGSNA